MEFREGELLGQEGLCGGAGSSGLAVGQVSRRRLLGTENSLSDASRGGSHRVGTSTVASLFLIIFSEQLLSTAVSM